MKRRDFIRNSAYTIAAAALLSGCRKDEFSIFQDCIIKRKFKDVNVPILGFGCQNLPLLNDGKNVDMTELEKMVEYSMNCGGNYFDTAATYQDKRSESAIGKVLSNYERNKYILADKLPLRLIDDYSDIRKIFEEQLKRCQVEYFDFYMVQNINKHLYGRYTSLNVHNELLNLKKEGKIKYLGFSFFGDPVMFEDIVAEKDWDFCQLQVNYLDWTLTNARELYSTAVDFDLPVIVADPLRANLLCDLPQNISGELNATIPNITPSDFALLWSASLNSGITVLSNPNNFEQVQHNMGIFKNYKKMTYEEKGVASNIAKLIQAQGEIPCVNCATCIEYCPRGINIPSIIALYNLYTTDKNIYKFKTYYETICEEERGEACTKCGNCKKICSKSINIPDVLEKAAALYKRPITKDELKLVQYDC